MNQLKQNDNSEPTKMKKTVLDFLTEKYQDPKTDALLDMASLVEARFKTVCRQWQERGSTSQSCVRTWQKFIYSFVVFYFYILHILSLFTSLQNT